MDQDDSEAVSEFSGGWVKMHRRLANERFFQDPNLLQLYCWLLFRARHQAGAVPFQTGNGLGSIRLEVGQAIVGRNTLAEALSWKPSTAWDRLQRLKELGMISIRSDTHCSIVSITNYQAEQYVEPVETDRPPSGKRQTTVRHATGKRQTTDTNRECKNEKKEKNETIERESSGVAAFPPTIEQISSLIDEYIKTNYSNEKTRELEQQIETLTTEAEAIKVATERLRDEGKIEKGTKEWSDAVREYNYKRSQVESRQSQIESELAQNGLSSVQKQHLAREFFNYWECEGWTERGKQIRLESQVNKWTQREISRKHKGSGSNDSKKKRVTLEVPPHRHHR